MANPILTVRNLTKTYPSFTLDRVSFSLERGQITGFLGRNGAGKSTTLNAILGLIHPEAGEILLEGTPVAQRRSRIGFASSGMVVYPKKTLKTLREVTSSFYDTWDQEAYLRYLTRFQLSEEKKPEQLSNGMKIKFSLALALSHGADLLLLDEPTSGMDPVSREELTETFLALKEEGKTILFSTQITSDLDKCADRVLYLRKGSLVEQGTLAEFADGGTLEERMLQLEREGGAE